MFKDKFTISIDNSIKAIDMREGLWNGLDEAVRYDPQGRYSNRSEAIRSLIRQFIREVKTELEEQKQAHIEKEIGK